MIAIATGIIAPVAQTATEIDTPCHLREATPLPLRGPEQLLALPLAWAHEAAVRQETGTTAASLIHDAEDTLRHLQNVHHAVVPLEAEMQMTDMVHLPRAHALTGDLATLLAEAVLHLRRLAGLAKAVAAGVHQQAVASRNAVTPCPPPAAPRLSQRKLWMRSPVSHGGRTPCSRLVLEMLSRREHRLLSATRTTWGLGLVPRVPKLLLPRSVPPLWTASWVRRGPAEQRGRCCAQLAMRAWTTLTRRDVRVVARELLSQKGHDMIMRG